METLGAFALTEPYVGSDAGGIRTRARRDGEAYVIEEEKQWTGNALDADVVLVWARNNEDVAGALLVEKAAITPAAPFMAGNGSARAHPDFDVSVMPQVRGIQKRVW
jgi:glutaryl-CoA dehydrogenase